MSFEFLSTETEEEKKAGVDPKLVFPLKLWLLSWLPSHRKRWNSNTGVPQSDDKEDWVQLGERKKTGSADQVSSIFGKLVFRQYVTKIKALNSSLSSLINYWF